MKEEGTNWQGLVDRTTLKFNSLVGVFLSLRINSASMRARVQARRGCPGRQGRRKSKHASLLNAMQSPTVRDLSQSLRPFALTSITYLGKGRVAKHPGPRGAPHTL